jgi:CRISPR type II-A-associated protein Csn2
MIISYATHKKMVMKNEGLSIISTHSQIAYTDLVKGFLQQNDKLLVCDDSYKRLSLNDVFDFVGDPILSDDITNKYMSIIIKSFVKELTGSRRDKILKAFNQLESLLQDELFMTDLPLQLSFDQDLNKFLKLERLHLSPDFISKPYDIIETVLRVHQECELQTIPVFCNVSHYLERDALQELSSLCNQMKLKVILIEFSDKDFLIVPSNAEYFYIDEDLVDWY